MKQFISLLTLVIATSVFAAEEKKVCIDKVDAKGQVVKGKDGKPAQDCKVIKIHKKLEGTEIPVKK